MIQSEIELRELVHPSDFYEVEDSFLGMVF